MGVALAVTTAAGAGLYSLGVLASDDGGRRTHVRQPAGQRALVSRVVDGDTVVLADGSRVRLIGIDTPEVGECGSVAAERALRRLVEGRRVRLVDPASVQDRDRYSRQLRYVEFRDTDASMAQLEAGLADARYDGRDGYDPHPRQRRYRAADAEGTSDCERAPRRTRRDSGRFVPPPGWTTDALTPGYTGCRQGYPGGYVSGVYVWRPIRC